MLLFLSVIEDKVLQSRLEEAYHLYKKDLLYVANNIIHDYHESEDVEYMIGHNKSSEESMMEAYYKMIGEAHIDNIIEELEKDKNDIDEMTVPKSLDNWFDSFEQRRKKASNRKKWIKRFRSLSSRAAVFLVILIACMTVVTMSVDAFSLVVT